MVKNQSHDLQQPIIGLFAEKGNPLLIFYDIGSFSGIDLLLEGPKIVSVFLNNCKGNTNGQNDSARDMTSEIDVQYLFYYLAQ